MLTDYAVAVAIGAFWGLFVPGIFSVEEVLYIFVSILAYNLSGLSAWVRKNLP